MPFIVTVFINGLGFEILSFVCSVIIPVTAQFLGLRVDEPEHVFEAKVLANKFLKRRLGIYSVWMPCPLARADVFRATIEAET